MNLALGRGGNLSCPVRPRPWGGGGGGGLDSEGLQLESVDICSNLPGHVKGNGQRLRCSSEDVHLQMQI
jgi:hypothetical protein